jgi:hypothetical protein
MRWLLVLSFLIAACGVTDPNVVACGDDCPGAQGGQGGSGGIGGGSADAGDDAQAGIGGGGSGGVAGPISGSGGSGDGGDAGTTAGQGGQGGEGCELCPSDTPHCDSGACVACTEDDHCDGGVCEMGTCVECRVDRDCGTAAESRCSTEHTCEPCKTKAHCMHLSQTPVCDEGECVECTASDGEACGAAPAGGRYVCDVLEKQCSETATRRSADLCEPCVSDDQCDSGQLCVLQRFDEVGDVPDEGEEDVGYFCFHREDGTPNGDCANAIPYVATLVDQRSVGGEEATVCGLRSTTCSAYRDFSVKPCSGMEDDTSCGDARFSDGVCEMFSSVAFRCTTPCGSDDDCDPGFGCTSTTPKFCSLQ